MSIIAEFLFKQYPIPVLRMAKENFLCYRNKNKVKINNPYAFLKSQVNYVKEKTSKQAV